MKMEDKDLKEFVDEELPDRVISLAEEEIRKQHGHDGGSPVEVYAVEAKSDNLEKKLDPDEEDRSEQKKSSKKAPVMMGCNCGAMWTVTGQNTEPGRQSVGVDSVKVEPYFSGTGSDAEKYVSGNGSNQDKKYVSGSGESQKDYTG
jgi:hypothetical protein